MLTGVRVAITIIPGIFALLNTATSNWKPYSYNFALSKMCCFFIQFICDVCFAGRNVNEGSENCTCLTLVAEVGNRRQMSSCGWNCWTEGCSGMLKIEQRYIAAYRLLPGKRSVTVLFFLQCYKINSCLLFIYLFMIYLMMLLVAFIYLEWLRKNVTLSVRLNVLWSEIWIQHLLRSTLHCAEKESKTINYKLPHYQYICVYAVKTI